LTWGNEVDGLLGRDGNPKGTLQGSHFSDKLKWRPPLSRTNQPGLVQHISLSQPVTKIEVYDNKVHAYLNENAAPPPSPSTLNSNENLQRVKSVLKR
jgi:hypothetical protein